MTDIFTAFHAPGSEKMIRKFYIGDLILESVTHKDQRQIDFEKGYRDLRVKLVKLGLFKSNPWFYVYKQGFNMGMWATACLMVYLSDSFVVHFASAILMGLFWQQCGWLAHDILHHQLFKKRKYGDLLGIFCRVSQCNGGRINITDTMLFQTFTIPLQRVKMGIQTLTQCHYLLGV